MIKGALLILASELMFASMGALVKAVSGSGLPNEMIVFLRSAVGTLIILPLVLAGGGLGNFKTRVPQWHLLRAMVGLSAMYCFFYALGRLPLADGMLLKMTAPIFMPIAAWYILSEAAGRYALLAIPLGFIGVVFVLKPEGDFNWIVLIGLAGGVFAAVAKVTVRRLSRTEPAARIVFYFATLSTALSFVPVARVWETPAPIQWLMLIGIAVLGTLGQILLTKGYASAPATRIAPFTYFSVVFATGYGYVFWDERLSLWFVAGALLIALAGFMALRGGQLRYARKCNAIAVDQPAGAGMN